MAALTLPEKFKIVDGSAGAVTTNGAVTCDYVSLKNAHKVWILASFNQAVGHATTVQPMMATTVAGAGATAITASVRWWMNAATATTDTLVRQTDGTIATLGAGIAAHQVIIEIDPAALAESYDVLGCVVSDSSQATNFVSVVYFLETQYQQATPPVAIA